MRSSATDTKETIVMRNASAFRALTDEIQSAIQKKAKGIDGLSGYAADADFLNSKINIAKFFISSVLPQVTGRLDAIEENDEAFLQPRDKYFIE
jgi:hypothetical protein